MECEPCRFSTTFVVQPLSPYCRPHIGFSDILSQGQDAALKATLSNPDITFEELNTTIKAQVAAGNVGIGKGYGISKAALNALTLVQAKTYPNLKVACLSPFS